MRAGFPEDNPWGDRQLDMSQDDFTSLLSEGISFSSSPGTGFEYSNLGYAILGYLISEISGTPYQEYIRREILDPPVIAIGFAGPQAFERTQGGLDFVPVSRLKSHIEFIHRTEWPGFSSNQVLTG